MKNLMHTTPDPAATEVDTVPLMNALFILLIFFIVISNFVRQSNQDIAAPSSPSARPPTKAIVISIYADDALSINGVATDLRTLRSRLELICAQNPLANLVIRADPASSTDRLVRVMDTSRLAGLESIGFARNDL